MPNWNRMKAVLAQELPSLEAQVKRILPDPFVSSIGMDDYPPCIILLVSKRYGYGREHPTLGKITPTLFEPDLQPIYALIGHVLQSFPKLNVKTKVQDGILYYKFWLEA